MSHRVHWTWLYLKLVVAPPSCSQPLPGLLPNGPASSSVPPASKAALIDPASLAMPHAAFTPFCVRVDPIQRQSTDANGYE